MNRYPSENPRPIILVVGTTCSGKTAFGVELARRFREEGVSLEIVGADARQIYRGIGVGTAKPGMEERGGVPHHMLDVAELGETFSAARYADKASVCIEDIYRRGAYPLVVGGSGLYIRALVEGFFEGPEAQPEIRERLEAEASRRGCRAMHERLAAVDPETAANLHPNDLRRVVRALEVYEATGRPVSRLRAEQKAPRFASPLYIGLRYPASALAGRIEQRVRRMLTGGMLEEVAMLAENNLTDARVFEGLGFQEALALRRGEMEEDEAVRGISRLHRNYAKRQRTWFRRLEGVNWYEPGEENFGVILRDAHDKVSRYLELESRMEGSS
ncbi:MAG: tRNA (adenosine(37)-N6)-dimethylallyltransferase MiaA [Nitrospinae bacterium]|nr:tRNA (adenosine(37)-N6)-dimethylallyltransferase MiaA [Nitrospinota bacterium]